MNRIPRKLCLVFVAVVLCFGAVLNAQPFEPIPDPIPALIPFGKVSVELQSVATGFASPVAATFAPEHPDTLFVCDQTGQIWAVDITGNGDKRLFVDLSSRLISIGLFSIKYDERGLLGLVFHPDFMRNSLFYTFTSEPVTGTADFSTLPTDVPPNCQSVVTEWRVNDPTAKELVFDPSYRRELLRIDKPQFNHNGGALAFGPDDRLYISVGDGGRADDLAPGHAVGGNGQSLDPGNVLGKILRIDPLGHDSRNGHYGIPENNPLLGKKGEPEIYAYGLRNPFRMSFDRKTGQLYVGDVGQNDIEEVDVIKPGGNYGWPVKEGTFLFANRDNCAPPRGPTAGCAYQDSRRRPKGLIDPIAEYDRVDSPNLNTVVRAAVIGGYVYRGDVLKKLRGRYVFGDYSGGVGAPASGHVFYLDVNKKIKELMIPNKIGPDGKTALGLAVLAFAEDTNGELYLLANRSGTLAGPDFKTFPGTSGEVFKLVPFQESGQ